MDGSDPLENCHLNVKKLPKTCHFFNKNCHFFQKLPMAIFWKKWQFFTIFWKKASFWQCFDTQMAIFQRVRYGWREVILLWDFLSTEAILWDFLCIEAILSPALKFLVNPFRVLVEVWLPEGEGRSFVEIVVEHRSCGQQEKQYTISRHIDATRTCRQRFKS